MHTPQVTPQGQNLHYQPLMVWIA